MVCELVASACASVWPALLEFRRFVRSDEALDLDAVAFLSEGEAFRLVTDAAEVAGTNAASGEQVLFVSLRDEERPAPPVSHFSAGRFRRGALPINGVAETLSPESAACFRLYLPMLVGALFARRRGEVFVTAHVAQTLDGRIACFNGHSQWISNEANLHHAHRIRALHDAVLVGRGTVEADDPALTVRHVAGDDPRRVVLNASASLTEREPGSLQVLRGEGCLLLVSADEHERRGAEDRTGDAVEVVAAPATADGRIRADDLARALLDRGLHSVFLEGGGRTMSNLFEERGIDLLHVHVAPLILGSGIAGFTLPEVDHLDRARRMTIDHFTLDGELLVECREPAVGAGDDSP